MLSLKQATTFSHYNYATTDKDNQLFGKEIGLRFAFGISDWDGTTMKEEAFADYGQINAYYERWNNTSDVLIKVKTRPCVLRFSIFHPSNFHSSSWFRSWSKREASKLNILKCNTKYSWSNQKKNLRLALSEKTCGTFGKLLVRHCPDTSVVLRKVWSNS